MNSLAKEALLEVLDRLHAHFFNKVEGRVVAPLAEKPACWGYVGMDLSKALAQLTIARDLLPGVHRPKWWRSVRTMPPWPANSFPTSNDMKKVA